MPAIQRSTFIIDENVDHEVTQFLAEQGHTTLLVRDELGEGTPDAAIVAYALREYGIVVTRNHHDFYPYAKQALDSGRRDHRHWGLLSLCCSAAAEVRRVKQLYDILMYEIGQAKQRYPDGLLLQMEIRDRFYVIHY